MQLLDEDDAPTDVQSIMGTPLSESEIESLLIQTTRSGPMGNLEDEEDLRISLAGVQEKTALLWHQGQWMRPHGASPTTYILKLPIGMVGHR